MEPSNRQQLAIDFDYDERHVKAAAEMAILIAPHVPRKLLADLSARIVALVSKRVSKFVEPKEPMRCHSCDDLVGPDERARVVACVRCALTGRSPGSTG
jgi:hypothetical protein